MGDSAQVRRQRKDALLREDCNVIMLGILLQAYPELADKDGGGFQARTIHSLDVSYRCMKTIDTLVVLVDERYARKHKSCEVRTKLRPQLVDILQNIEGFDLDSEDVSGRSGSVESS